MEPWLNPTSLNPTSLDIELMSTNSLADVNQMLGTSSWSIKCLMDMVSVFMKIMHVNNHNRPKIMDNH